MDLLRRIALVRLEIIERNMFNLTCAEDFAEAIEQRDSLEEFVYGSAPAPDFLFND